MTALVSASIVIIAGCAVTDAGCDTSSPLEGEWRYSARQEIPVSAAVQGTLVFSAAGCGIVAGQLDVTTTDDLGASRRLAGMVSGTLFDNGSIRFDAELPGGTWQHLATVTGDSLQGNWAGTGNTGTMSGSFGGRRR